MNLDLEMGTKGLERPEECAEINAEWARGMLSLGSGKTAMCIICAVLACIILCSSTSVRPGRRLGLACVDTSTPCENEPLYNNSDHFMDRCARNPKANDDQVDAKRGKHGCRFSCSHLNLMRCTMCGFGWDVIDFVPCCCYWLGVLFTPLFCVTACRQCSRDALGTLVPGKFCGQPCANVQESDHGSWRIFGFNCDGYVEEIAQGERKKRLTLPETDEARANHIIYGTQAHWYLFEIACCFFGCSWSPCQCVSDWNEKEEDMVPCCGCCKCIKGYGSKTYKGASVQQMRAEKKDWCGEPIPGTAEEGWESKQ